MKKVLEISKKAQALKKFIADKAVNKLEQLKNHLRNQIKKFRTLKSKFAYSQSTDLKNFLKSKIHDIQKNIRKDVEEIQSIKKIKATNDAPKQIIAKRVPHPVKTPIIEKIKINNLNKNVTKKVEQIIKLQNKVKNVREGMKPILKKKIQNLKKEVKQDIKQIKKIKSSIINKANNVVDTKVTRKVEKINKTVPTPKIEQKLEAKNPTHSVTNAVSKVKPPTTVNSYVKSLQQKKRKIKSLIKKIVEKAAVIPNKISIQKKIVDLKSKVKEISKKIQNIRSKIPKATPEANSNLNNVNRSNPPSSVASEIPQLREEIRTTFLSRLADITAKNKLDKQTFRKIYNHFMNEKNINVLIKLEQASRNAKIDEFIRSFLAHIKN
jgi:hypothetical protein